MTGTHAARCIAMLTVSASLLGAQAAPTIAAPGSPARAEERAILSELVSIDWSSHTPRLPRLAQAVARRTRAAGFAAADVQMLGPTPALSALVVR